MKAYKIISIVLFTLFIGIFFSNKFAEEECSRREFLCKGGSLISIKGNNELYDKCLNLSFDLDKLDIQLINKKLQFFIVIDKIVDKEIVVIKGEDKLLMLSSNVDSNRMPYKLLKGKIDKGIISREQYLSVASNFDKDIFWIKKMLRNKKIWQIYL